MPYFEEGRLWFGGSLFSREGSPLHMLARGVYVDVWYKYCRVSKNIAMEYMKWFCIAILEGFGAYHLRQPTKADFDK